MLPRCIFFNSYITNVMHHRSRVHISFPIDFLKISFSIRRRASWISRITNFLCPLFASFADGWMNLIYWRTQVHLLKAVFPCIRVVCFLVTCTFFSAFFRSITRHDDSANFFFYFISFGTCVVFAWSIYPEIYLLSLLAQQIRFSFYN